MRSALKVPWNALKHAALFCVDVILTETGRQGGTYQAAPPLFKIANSFRLYHSLQCCQVRGFSAELGYFNTVAAGCFSCPRVEATPITWYLAPGVLIFTCGTLPKNVYFTRRNAIFTGEPLSKRNWPIISPAPPLSYCCSLGQTNGVAHCLTMTAAVWKPCPMMFLHNFGHRRPPNGN